MKVFNRTITLAAMAAALMMTPATGASQTPPPSQPPAAQPPASATEQPPAPGAAKIDAAREHLAKANASLTEVDTAQLSARTKAQIADVKKRINTLEKTLASSDKAAATGTAKSSASRKAEWGTEIAAIDKTLTMLLGPEGTTGSTTPPATGTSGSKSAAALDETTRTKLMEVRTHLTAFATAMAGGDPRTPDAPSPDPAAAASTTPSSATPSTTTPPSSTTPPATGAPPTSTPQPTGTSGTTPAQSTPAQSTPEQSTQPPAAAQPDEQAARRHLTEARNTLSALTQLPEASQLTGDARTQVSQLISNFNELITTQSEWRGSYAKVTANLNALLGPDVGTPDPSTSGTTGAVGTSGAGVANLDPGIRTKLVELRQQLSQFEKAAGGGAATAAQPDPAANPNAPANTPPVDPSSTAPPSGNPPTTPPSTAPPTGTPETTPPAQSTQPTAGGNAEVMQHVAAIEALLKLEDEGGGLTLTKAQVEQLRSHWAALRLALDKK